MLFHNRMYLLLQSAIYIFLIFCKANFNQFFFFMCLHISCNLKCISVSIANHEATNNYLHLLFCGNAIWCISTLQSTWVCQLVPSSNGNTRVVFCFLCFDRRCKLDSTMTSPPADNEPLLGSKESTLIQRRLLLGRQFQTIRHSHCGQAR